MKPAGKRKRSRLLSRGGFWALAWFCWLAALFYLSSRPVPDTPFTFHLFGIPHGDKILHFGWFFGGAGLLAAAVHCLWRPRARVLALVVIPLLSGIGALDEYHQTFTEERDGKSLGDWVADTAGAAAGTFVFLAFRQRYPGFFRRHGS